MRAHSRQGSSRHSKPPLTSIPLPLSTHLSLTTLDLSHNHISIMENLHKLRSLQILNLSFNNISKIENIFSLQQLHSVVMSHNLIESLPEEIKGIPKLRVLDISYNKVLYIHAISALEGKQMEVFNVEGNRVVKRPKFQETMQRIMKHKEEQLEGKEGQENQGQQEQQTNNEILEQEYLQKQFTDQNTLQNTIQNVIFPKEGETLFSEIQLLGTFRSITELSNKAGQNDQLERILQIKDKELFAKKNEIIAKYHQILQYPERVDTMIEQDRPEMEEQSHMVRVIGKYMLDIQLMTREIAEKVKERIESILVSFDSCNILDSQTGLKGIIEQNEVEHQRLLISYLSCNQETAKSMGSNISKIKQYLMVFNSLKADVIVLDKLAIEYIQEFNHLYRVIELKTVLEDPLGSFQHVDLPNNSTYQNTIHSLEAQIVSKNLIEEQLIRQNNILLEKVDELEGQNRKQQKEIRELKERWKSLEEMKEEGNILMDSIIMKQETIARMMGEKFGGDMFQSIMLNQAQTIQSLLNQNKQIREALYIQQITEKTQHGQRFGKNQYCKYSQEHAQTCIETGRKKLVKQIKSQECSAESNLLSDRPEKRYVQLPVFPINYFSKSFNLIKSKASQVTTHRNSQEHTRYIESTSRNPSNPHKQNYDLFQNTVGKTVLLTKRKKSESEGYKDYMRYYLRNNIIETLIEKNTHQKVRKRYSENQLRLRKFKEMTGKRILSKK